MINYLIAILFVLSIAATTTGILVSVRLRNTFKTDFFPTLIFYQVFYFSFGFYAIWGQFFATSFLSPFVTPDLLHRIIDLMVLLGMPFLALDSIMLLRFSRDVSGRKTGRFFLLWILLVNALLIFGVGYIFVEYQYIKTFTVVKYYYILITFLFTALNSFYLITGKKLQYKLLITDRKMIVSGLVALLIVQSTLLILYKDNIYIALLFILVYFSSGCFVPLYLRYIADLSVLLPKSERSDSFERFCKKYEISKRETEIIHEICKGLTNQQIADKLFISLQTVKDHTHRIYFKTECSSRAQLMHMVSEMI